MRKTALVVILLTSGLKVGGAKLQTIIVLSFVLFQLFRLLSMAEIKPIFLKADDKSSINIHLPLFI